MRKLKSLITVMCILGFGAGFLACSGSDVSHEEAQLILEFVGTLPGGEVTPSGISVPGERKLEIVIENLEEPEHDFYYVLWAVDTDGIPPMYIPMEVVDHSGTTGVGHLHEDDLLLAGSYDFTSIDQILISIEFDADDDGEPEVITDPATPQTTAPAAAMLFSDDFSGVGPGGLQVIAAEHIHFGDGLTDTEFEHMDFMRMDGSYASYAEVRIDYLNHTATVKVHDTPLPPPEYHYALWGSDLDGSMVMELADVDLEDPDSDGVGEVTIVVGLQHFDLFAGITFEMTLEANEGEESKSPVVILSGELACAPGHCGEEAGGVEEAPTGGEHAH